MTDDISMGALSGSIAERTRAAIGAGCDVVLHCNGKMSEMQAVAAQAPVLAGAALARAQAALASRKPPLPIDVAASRAAFLKLMNGVWEPAQGYV
jgi:beta-N-acetylhexosaminidase